MGNKQNSHSQNNVEKNGSKLGLANEENFYVPSDPSAVSWDRTPDTAEEMINTYGTYEIQATSESKNEFPAISQGLPSENIKPRPKSFREGIIPIMLDSDQRQ